MSSTKPAAGWYPTPEGPLRYWDGHAWTQHTAPPLAAPPTQARRRGTPVYTDPHLLTSTPLRVLFGILTVLTCGLYGFVWLGVELVARSLKTRGY